MSESWDVIVIGSGPAGQKAAVQAAKAGKRVCIIEREIGVGGACVHRGTIPSKTLRETALYLGQVKSRIGRHVKIEIPPDLQLASLMDRMERVVSAHVEYQSRQMERNGIEQIHGRGRFLDARHIAVESIRGERRVLEAPVIVIATGSRPRTPEGIPVDHEHIYDSDSILSMSYLPKSLAVLGGGVIASEYATIFASLGVEVTMIDRYPTPLGFLDHEILLRFVQSFEAHDGCTFIGNSKVESVAWDGVSEVVTTLDNGWQVRTQKVLCALGRVANIEDLDIAAAGLSITERGIIPVDADCQTSTPGIYAVGDVIGPPSLASASMEQGRRAMRHALSMQVTADNDLLPSGIYTIPEIAAVGQTAKQLQQDGVDFVVGRAKFSELARGQISGSSDGLLMVFVEVESRRILGCQVIGEGATELVHLAQLAMINGNDITLFVDKIFNFPTLAEAYRVAALDVVEQLDSRSAPTVSG